MAKVHEWIKANKLPINFDKSNFMIMSSSRKAYITLKIYIFMSMIMKLSKLLNVHLWKLLLIIISHPTRCK